PASLAVIQDMMRHDHPAFAGIQFELPAGATPSTNPSDTYHGTALLSVAVSQGASGCSICGPDDAEAKGIAPGVSKILDADFSMDDAAWATGVPYRYDDNRAGTWRIDPGSADPAHVWVYSRGASGVTSDDTTAAQAWDSYVDGYGTTAAIAAGNDGSARSI